jgi:pimeloyl-[acyl-carrier protein] synthase
MVEGSMSQADFTATEDYVQFCHGRLADPYPLFQRLIAEDPVHWSELLDAWVITRYGYVRSGLRDLRLSSARIPLLMNCLPRAMQEQVSNLNDHLSKWVSQVNPPDHTRLRRLVDIAFTPKMLEAMRPRIEGITSALIDKVENRGQMDVINDFAYPLPATVISEMLGVRAEDQYRFREWADDIMYFVGGSFLTLHKIAVKASRSLNELTEYLLSIIQDRKSRPREDLISALVIAEVQGEKLNAAEVVAMCTQLLTAGHQTTMQLISNGTLALLNHPDELEKLENDPSLIMSTIEEILRFEGPTQRQTRLVGEDLEIGGKQIKKGSTVFLMLGAANRDPAEFPEPDRFDICRKPNPHVAFSAGIHYCLGAPLARLEGAIAINTLFRRLPQMRLATHTLKWRENMSQRLLESLPVSFGHDRWLAAIGPSGCGSL